MLSVVWGGRGCTCTVVKLLTRRGCKGEMFGKRTKGELHVEGGGREEREERGGETMINGYLCALSHYNVRNLTLQCICTCVRV